MVRRSLNASLAALLTVGLFAVGCGPGGEEEPSDDAGADTTVEDTGSEDTAEGDDTGTDAGDECGKTCVEDRFRADAPPLCGEDGAPDRCEADPTGFDFDPGSAVTNLELTSNNATEDCCFDVNGDGQPENALGNLLGLIPDTNVDAEIISNLVADEPYSDDIVLLLEHQGLESIGQSNEFMINFFLGAYGDQDATDYLTKDDSNCSFSNKKCATTAQTGRNFNVDPQSFDGGTQPQAQVPQANFPDGSNVEAGPGKVILSISSPTLGDISLTINGATIEGEINESETDIGNSGVVIENGKLGGYVTAKDIVRLIDNLLSDCNCLGLGEGEDAIVYPTKGDDSEPDLTPPSCDENSGEECKVGCSSTVEMNTDQCGGDAGGVCGAAGDVCGLFSSLLTFADLDLDGDGTNDAFSAGALFEATGANIVGVEPIIQAGDQQLSSGSVNVPTYYMNNAGWIVIHADDNGSPGNIVGTAEVDAGLNNDTSVSLDNPGNVSDGDKLYAMLHADDGGSVGNPIENGLGNVVVTSFTISK